MLTGSKAQVPSLGVPGLPTACLMFTLWVRRERSSHGQPSLASGSPHSLYHLSRVVISYHLCRVGDGTLSSLV